MKKAGSSREKLSGQAQVSSCRPRGAVGRVACARRRRRRSSAPAVPVARAALVPTSEPWSSRRADDRVDREEEVPAAPAGGRGARPQSILIIRRAFDRFGQTAFPKIEVAGRPRSDAPRARGRGRCGRAARAARELPPPRHQTMGGDPVGVVVSPVGGWYDERDYRVIPCRAAARAELRGVRAARAGLRQALCVPSPRVGTS